MKISQVIEKIGPNDDILVQSDGRHDSANRIS
jgi:hypothetical protein